MPRYTKTDARGNVAATYTISEQMLRDDPAAVVTAITAEGDKAPNALKGYKHLVSFNGDPDGFRSNVSTHVFCKEGCYEEEAPDELTSLRSVIDTVEAQMQESEETMAGPSTAPKKGK